MIDGKTILAVIPARGGSKGVPRKNLRLLGESPLIAWSIAAANRSRLIDRLVVSSDDDEIIVAAGKWGCDWTIRRPDALASDEAPVEDALIHVLDSSGDTFDYLVLLQPTSPLRAAIDIDETIRACHENRVPACLTVCESTKSPYWMYHRDETGRLHPIVPMGMRATRRQDLPVAFALNGAVYVAEVPWFRAQRTFLTDATIGYVMPQDRSFDIDTEFDFSVVSALVALNGFDDIRPTSTQAQ